MAHDWENYNHDCRSCYDNYASFPQQGPCYQHRSGGAGNRELDDANLGLTSGWLEGAEPYDFAAEPRLLERLRFQKWLWGAKPQEAH